MNDRPRGVTVYPMPESVCGPFGNRYALIIRGDEARMVHTEGVAYLVNADKPWRWNDYTPSEEWTIADLIPLAVAAEPVDLADWVRVHNARLEDNFSMIYGWARS